MRINSVYTKIRTDETLRETVSHGSAEYPFRYYLEDIWQFDLHCIDWHWHSEVEFVFVQKGRAAFLIGSQRYVLQEGDGIFINARILHRFEADGQAVIPNMVFSPSLLSGEESLIYRKYIQPVLCSPVECLLLSPSVPWQKETLDLLQAVFGMQQADAPCELDTVRLLLKIWGMIYAHLPPSRDHTHPKSAAHPQARLQIMMQYIHTCYAHPLSLEDIAKAAALSKSGALQLFGRYLHVSPVRYLINYRLKQAARLLVTTESSIALIAQNTGFESPGYFCRKFKELFKITPGEYRSRGNAPSNAPAKSRR